MRSAYNNITALKPIVKKVVIRLRLVGTTFRFLDKEPGGGTRGRGVAGTGSARYCVQYLKSSVC